MRAFARNAGQNHAQAAFFDQPHRRQFLGSARMHPAQTLWHRASHSLTCCFCSPPPCAGAAAAAGAPCGASDDMAKSPCLRYDGCNLRRDLAVHAACGGANDACAANIIMRLADRQRAMQHPMQMLHPIDRCLHQEHPRSHTGAAFDQLPSQLASKQAIGRLAGFRHCLRASQAIAMR